MGSRTPARLAAPAAARLRADGGRRDAGERRVDHRELGPEREEDPTRAARTFDAKQGPLSGTAKVTAVAAGPRSSHEWQYSTDGGKTWVNAPTTIQAKTVITGLAAGATVQFRYRPVTKTGEGDWSQPASLLVK
jgi:hypothetical protein